MRVLASGGIFFESGTVDLPGNFWFPGHFEKKFLVEKKFFLTVNQLKKTSDCIKIDPPGPGRSLEKSQKKSKKGSKILDDFFGFFGVWVFFANQIFYKQKQSFFSQARPFGARWAGPPLLFLGWKYWKSSQEKVSRKTAVYFLEKMCFSHQNVLKPI